MTVITNWLNFCEGNKFMLKSLFTTLGLGIVFKFLKLESRTLNRSCSDQSLGSINSLKQRSKNFIHIFHINEKCQRLGPSSHTVPNASAETWFWSSLYRTQDLTPTWEVSDTSCSLTCCITIPSSETALLLILVLGYGWLRGSLSRVAPYGHWHWVAEAWRGQRVKSHQV